MAEPKKSKKEFHRSVFRKVMSHYDEIKSCSGTLSVGGFYKNLSREGVNGGKFNPRIVYTNTSDFICDVEIAVQRVLNKEEKRFYDLVYINKDEEIAALADGEWPDNKYKELKHKIQEKLGLAFKARGLYPLAKYLKPRDLR